MVVLGTAGCELKVFEFFLKVLYQDSSCWVKVRVK